MCLSVTADRAEVLLRARRMGQLCTKYVVLLCKARDARGPDNAEKVLPVCGCP